MTATILTDEQVESALISAGYVRADFKLTPQALANSRAIEQAVLQSPEVQAWKKKAAMIDFLQQHHGADISILLGGEWEVCGSDIYGIGATLAEAFDVAMEKQP